MLAAVKADTGMSEVPMLITTTTTTRRIATATAKVLIFLYLT